MFVYQFSSCECLLVLKGLTELTRGTHLHCPRVCADDVVVGERLHSFTSSASTYGHLDGAGFVPGKPQ